MSINYDDYALQSNSTLTIIANQVRHLAGLPSDDYLSLEEMRNILSRLKIPISPMEDTSVTDAIHYLDPITLRPNYCSLQSKEELTKFANTVRQKTGISGSLNLEQMRCLLNSIPDINETYSISGTDSMYISLTSSQYAELRNYEDQHYIAIGVCDAYAYDDSSICNNNYREIHLESGSTSDMVIYCSEQETYWTCKLTNIKVPSFSESWIRITYNYEFSCTSAYDGFNIKVAIPIPEDDTSQDRNIRYAESLEYSGERYAFR